MAKIALGHGREAIQPDCLQALVVEFICTFLFVFAGVGAAMATGKSYILEQIKRYFLLIEEHFEDAFKKKVADDQFQLHMIHKSYVNKCHM